MQVAEREKQVVGLQEIKNDFDQKSRCRKSPVMLTETDVSEKKIHFHMRRHRSKFYRLYIKRRWQDLEMRRDLNVRDSDHPFPASMDSTASTFPCDELQASEMQRSAAIKFYNREITPILETEEPKDERLSTRSAAFKCHSVFSREKAYKKKVDSLKNIVQRLKLKNLTKSEVIGEGMLQEDVASLFSRIKI